MTRRRVRPGVLGAFTATLLSILHAPLQEYINVSGAPAVFGENAEWLWQPTFTDRPHDRVRGFAEYLCHAVYVEKGSGRQLGQLNDNAEGFGMLALFAGLIHP